MMVFDHKSYPMGTWHPAESSVKRAMQIVTSPAATELLP